MDILLFNQYFSSKKAVPEKNLAAMPLNLLHIASYLKQKEINCKIYELGAFTESQIRLENNRLRCGMTDAEIVEIIKNEKPKIIRSNWMRR